MINSVYTRRILSALFVAILSQWSALSLAEVSRPCSIVYGKDDLKAYKHPTWSLDPTSSNYRLANVYAEMIIQLSEAERAALHLFPDKSNNFTYVSPQDRVTLTAAVNKTKPIVNARLELKDAAKINRDLEIGLHLVSVQNKFGKEIDALDFQSFNSSSQNAFLKSQHATRVDLNEQNTPKELKNEWLNNQEKIAFEFSNADNFRQEPSDRILGKPIFTALQSVYSGPHVVAYLLKVTVAAKLEGQRGFLSRKFYVDAKNYEEVFETYLEFSN